MKASKYFSLLATILVVTFSCATSNAGGQDYSGQEDPNKKILKQGLLGAGVGAVSAGASGGSAGKGALIGAGSVVTKNVPPGEIWAGNPARLKRRVDAKKACAK